MAKNMVEEFTNRYIYDVTKRLPQNQREDVDKELRTLIEDMLNERTSSPIKEDIENVLYELGKPSELASKYRGKKRYLIGPELFDSYVFILKIALLAVTIGIVVSRIVSIVFDPPENVITEFALSIAAVFNGLIMTVGFVTLWFFIYENIDKKKVACKEWSVKDLPQVPAKNLKISRVETAFVIICCVVLLVIMNFALHILGVISISDEGTLIIPLFNSEVLSNYLPAINLLLALFLISALIKFVVGKYTLKLSIVIIGINIITIGITLYVFTKQGIWNTNLFQFISDMGNQQADVQKYSNIFRTLAPIAFIIPTVSDSISTLVKGIKYSKTN